MSWIDKVTHGDESNTPERAIILAPPGTGKTSASISFPEPVHIEAEPSLDAFPNQPRFPRPRSWEDIDGITEECVKRAKAGKFKWKTLIYDTLDAMEQLCWEYTCKHNYTGKKWESIETPGWEKGQKAALRYWRIFSAQLDELTAEGINVVLNCHTTVGKFKNPDGLDFNRYTMKLHPTAAHHWMEWASDVFFLTHSYAVQTTGGSNDSVGPKKAVGQSDAKRVVYTTWDAAHDAKHRRRLPESFPLPDPLKGSFYDTLQAERAEAMRRVLAGEDENE